MGLTTSEIAPVTTTASTTSATPAGRKKSAGIVAPRESDLAWSADERKKYGIAPKGAGPHAPSSYGFPLPPADHPKAKDAARAVLSRAHQGKNFEPADVAKQVRKARKILGEPANGARESAAKPLGMFALREVGASDATGATPVIVIREGPGNLGDRHWYPASTLKATVNSGVIEGAQCYLDHPTPTEDREIPERSVRSLGGWYSDAKLIDYVDPKRGACKAIEAIFHPQIGKEDVVGMLRTCVEYAKRYPDKAYVGLSINARGDGAPATIDGEEWNRVDLISEVDSIDLVTRAGAGGRPIAFRESYKMITATKTIVPEKLKEAVIAVRDQIKAKFLSESAIQLTTEQDQALDSALGLVDGGLLDRAIDQATGVAPTGDDDVDDDEETDDMETTEDDAGMTEATDANIEEADEEVTEADLAPLKGKSTDELMQIAATHKKKADKLAGQAVAAKAGEMTESAARKAEGQKLVETQRKLVEANRRLKETAVDRILAEQKVPDNFRPMLKRELMERASLTTDAQIAGFATDWASAHVKPVLDGSGVTFRESAGGSNKIALTFAGSAND